MNSRSSVAACVLSMTLAAGAHAGPPPKVLLGGGGGNGPDIELSTTSLDFGNVHLGASPLQSVIVSNVGDQHLIVSLSVTPGSPPTFFLVDPLVSFSVPPSGQQEVILTFYPTSVGSHEGSLDIQSDDPVDPLLHVSLSGEGYEANLASLTGTPDPVAINGAMTFTVVLDSPAGPADVSVEISTSPTALIDVPPSVTVLQGEMLAQFQATAGSTPGAETIYASLHSLSVTDEIRILTTVGVDAAPVNGLRLGPVAPNPVRRTSLVGFALPSSAHVRLEVFDLMGRSVATLADGIFPAGRHELPWSPNTTRSGMFMVRLESLGETRVIKAVVVL